MLKRPSLILFDWHGTLVDTLDAMYNAMADMLPLLEELGLVEELLQETACATEADARLVRFIRIYRQVHPRTQAERRISRTEIFNAIFGENTEAKGRAHAAYNASYRKHFGEVKPFEPGVGRALAALKALGIKLGVATNRSRDFLEKELDVVEAGAWRNLLTTWVCADDLNVYKPDPAILFEAIQRAGEMPGAQIWYIGDSPTDMKTATLAGITPIFYQARPSDDEDAETHHWLRRSEGGVFAPEAEVVGFQGVFDLLGTLPDAPDLVAAIKANPPDCPLRPPLRERVEPDWHLAVARLHRPTLILFDWHATLVDTLDAMYHAVDDLLPELDELGLSQRLVPPEKSRSADDARLVAYVKEHKKLHPKIRADRKISRTDIFELLFGEDQKAKRVAHEAFNKHYRNHYGVVLPFEPKVREMLEGLRQIGLVTGVITNRDREFFEHELASVEGMGWQPLFDTQVCGDDVAQRKPHPDQLLLATENLARRPGPDVWYVGDSTTDTVAAKKAGMTSVFFNGAQWDQLWLTKIFPGTEQFPYKPDVVVNNFSEFWALVLACREADGG
ncbi:MAG: HAD hydrolase-like protein [Hahellaceae bacterium]|nr:HAD hydrolase-like protein [Hahellaceae bacterium]